MDGSWVLKSPEYIGHKLLIYTAIFVPAQVICVSLRYVCRYLVKASWGLDDLIVLASLVLQICMGGICVGAVRQAAAGHHILYLEETSPEKVFLWGKYLVAIAGLYFFSVNIPKLAILALYDRIFPQRSVRLAIRFLVVVLISLSISTFIVVLAACRPFAANWNVELPGAHCIDKEAFFRYGSLPNIITDIIMLVLPIRVVYNLQTSKRLKIGLCITFVVGSVGLITSIVRFTTFYRSNSFIDGSFSAVDLAIWTQTETGMYLISACLMSYRPLLERFTSTAAGSKLTKISSFNQQQQQERQSEERRAQMGPARTSRWKGPGGAGGTCGKDSDQESTSMDIPLKHHNFLQMRDNPQRDLEWAADPGIRVTTDIEVD